MIVVDATIWVDLLRGVISDRAMDAIDRSSCVSPPHVDVEVGSALVRAERRGVIAAGQAVDLARAFSLAPVERPRHRQDSHAAFSYLDNATYADAWYLAMAARLDCPVLTSDRGMAETAAIHGVSVLTA